jgi:hypothetical protein
VADVRVVRPIRTEPLVTSTTGYLRMLGWLLTGLLWLDWLLALVVYNRYAWEIYWPAVLLLHLMASTSTIWGRRS